WNVSCLTATNDKFDTLFYYGNNIYDYQTQVFVKSFQANLTIGGFTAKNISLGASTESRNWYPFFGDGALGLCNPALFSDVYPQYLHVEWFRQLGLSGDSNRFAIFLPKYGAGNLGELTIGETNTARYKGSIQW
ncbi:hypothetical protein HDU76_010213, partial [Blyttiomyces sp. JEL0837]